MNKIVSRTAGSKENMSIDIFLTLAPQNSTAKELLFSQRFHRTFKITCFHDEIRLFSFFEGDNVERATLSAVCTQLQS